jgi:hypothetical protein
MWNGVGRVTTGTLYEEMEYYIPIYGQYRFAQDIFDPDVEVTKTQAARQGTTSAMAAIASDQLFHGGTGKSMSYVRHVRHVSVVANPATLTYGLFGLLIQQNFAMIRRAPREARKGMWRMFSSALAGSSWNVTGSFDF